MIEKVIIGNGVADTTIKLGKKVDFADFTGGAALSHPLKNRAPRNSTTTKKLITKLKQ